MGFLGTLTQTTKNSLSASFILDINPFFGTCLINMFPIPWFAFFVFVDIIYS
jgi:hypothetical protein